MLPKAPLKALPNTSNMARPAKTAMNWAGTSLTAVTAILAERAKQNQNTPSKKAAMKRSSCRGWAAELEQMAVLGPAVTAGWAPRMPLRKAPMLGIKYMALMGGL